MISIVCAVQFCFPSVSHILQLMTDHGPKCSVLTYHYVIASLIITSPRLYSTCSSVLFSVYQSHFAVDDGPLSEMFCVNRYLNYVRNCSKNRLLLLQDIVYLNYPGLANQKGSRTLQIVHTPLRCKSFLLKFTSEFQWKSK